MSKNRDDDGKRRRKEITLRMEVDLEFAENFEKMKRSLGSTATANDVLQLAFDLLFNPSLEWTAQELPSSRRRAYEAAMCAIEFFIKARELGYKPGYYDAEAGSFFPVNLEDVKGNPYI